LFVNSSRGKILVIRGGAIGDFILTLPAIAALRRQFPDAHLEVLGYPHIVQLAGELVDRVQSIEARALAGFFARNGALEPDLAGYFSEFDIIISYLFDPDEIFKKNVARCSTAQFIVGPHRPNEKEPLHATKVYLKPLERLAIFEADNIPRISFQGQPRIAPKPVESGSTFNQIALHPGSGSEKKNWPEANWANLLQYLLGETNAAVLLIGGEAEGERLQRLAAALPPQRIKVAQSLPLTDLARLLQTCTAFVGHDSGISHLAAAVGLPGVILWSDTVEAIWRPPHEAVRIIRNNTGLKGLSVKEVLRELGGLLNK
jgi:heptosyltransferase-2